MTYYTDGRGALRALRTGPFEVGIIKNAQLRLLRGHQSAFFHIDDFRRRKLQAHWETRLYWNVIQWLTLRLSGGLEAEDICIHENTGRMKGFSIINRNTKFLSGQSNQNFPIMYIYWDALECLTFNVPSFDASRSDGDQEPFSAKERFCVISTLMLEIRSQPGSARIRCCSSPFQAPGHSEKHLSTSSLIVFTAGRRGFLSLPKPIL